jgi:prepilin-type N-terminal cleavage/methylation domain-containing protein
MGCRRTRRARGFSLLELMITVSIATMGFVALLTLQTATMRGMANTRHLIQATGLGENFIEQLRLEFISWTDNPGEGLSNEANYPHLAGLPTDAAATAGATSVTAGVNNAPGWVNADIDGGEDRRVSVVGDPHPFGFNSGIRAAMITPGAEDIEQPYCMRYRLTWLIPGRAIRAEVEVAWPLENANIQTFLTCANLASSNLGEMRSVTLMSTLAINVFQR